MSSQYRTGTNRPPDTGRHLPLPSPVSGDHAQPVETSLDGSLAGTVPSGNSPLCTWDDESLIAALQRREHAAITYAVETYAPKLYRYAFYQLSDAASAEDLVSEVIMRMLEKIDDVRYVGAPFQSWLFSIARNLVADSYRRKARAQVLSLDNPLHREATRDLVQLDADVEIMADRQALVKVMANLTEEQRQVLTLRIIEGWQPAEIARLLGRSIDSVKSLQYRALQSLRRFWERDMEAGGPFGLANMTEEEIG